MQIDEVIANSPVRAIEGSYFVLRLPPGHPGLSGAFLVARDEQETTIICDTGARAQAPQGEERGPFSLLQFRVAIPFEAPGFLAAIAAALAVRKISVLIVSTFSFDYVLVAEKECANALRALRAMGFPVEATP